MNPEQTPTRRIYSVSEFSASLSKEISARFPSICVRGEVTNLSKPRSGHWYFSLKDESAQIRAVMFRSANLKAHQVADGEEIIACGRPSIYRNRGDLQLQVSNLQLAGAGELQRQFEVLKNELQAAGYFDRATKVPVPRYPKQVAVVTSTSGAVLHDIRTVCQRRAPGLPLLVIPSSVQGPDAQESLVAAVERADRRPDVDLIILARGGGSLEDMAAFNSRELADALIRCQTPVVSSVGHESDISIADLVADVRAATPSEAAELVTESFQELPGRLQNLAMNMSRLIARVLQSADGRLALTTSRMRNPAESLTQASQRLDSLEPLLDLRVRQVLQVHQSRLAEHTSRLNTDSLRHSFLRASEQLASRKTRLVRAQTQALENRLNALKAQTKFLHALSPLAVMSRGYGISEREDGTILRSAQQARPGDIIHTRLGNGSLNSEVISTRDS